MANVLVTGGTGSFGQAFVRLILDSTDWTVRIFSRDEQKQDAMKRTISSDRVRYLLGDIRDPVRLRRAMTGCDYVVHAAALKIIPAGEYNPDEVIKTNVMGSHNVIEAAIDAGVKRVVCLSSDKAVSPVNLYGYTKACMEKLALLANGYSGDTSISVVRYGNVIGSRGSILTLLKRQAAEGQIDITHTDMTRFWITLPQTAEFVMETLTSDLTGLFIPKMVACRVMDLCQRLYPGTPIRFTGMRNGEKMHEILTNEHEVVEDIGWAYRLNTDVWRSGLKRIESNANDICMSARDLLQLPAFESEVRLAAQA